MAHMAHYTAAQVGVMLSHYGREEDDGVTRGNENIRPDATASNYVVFPDRKYSTDTHHWASDVRRFVRKCIAETNEARAVAGKRKMRSNATVMSDVVFTLPKDWPAGRDPYDFFSLCHQFMFERYGGECSLPGFVHMDETTPHMHCPIVPRVDGQISKRDVISRADLKSFHGDLQTFLDKELGFHVSVTLDDAQKVEKAKSKLTQDELDALNKAIKAEVEAEVAERQRELDLRASELSEGEEALARDKEAFKKASGERESKQNERDREQDRRKEELDRQEASVKQDLGLLATLKSEVLALLKELRAALAEQRTLSQSRLDELEPKVEDLQGKASGVTVEYDESYASWFEDTSYDADEYGIG